MSVCTQPGWRATQRTPCSRYPRDWHLVSMFRAACGTQGRDSGGRGRVAAGERSWTPRQGQGMAGGARSRGHMVLLHYPHADTQPSRGPVPAHPSEVGLGMGRGMWCERDPVTNRSSVTVRRGAGTEGGIGRPVGLLGGGQRLGSHPVQRGGTLLQRYDRTGARSNR